MTSRPDLEPFAKNRVVGIVRTNTAERAYQAAKAILAGGISLIEITMNTPGALDVIRRLAAESTHPVGAGTVMDTDTADAAIAAGARFIVSPHTDPDLIAHVKAKGALAVPGALSPTEVVRAWRAGADIVKVFPTGAVGGPDYIQLLRGPLPDIRIMPTGGVLIDAVQRYLDVGCFAVGLTSALLPAAALEAEDWPQIRERAHDLMRRLARPA
jgi:2-dehydro-3-deoxyphosphogluconate aldolase/(4S)-4-hydroxy-2-oxoglutarate aldolase